MSAKTKCAALKCIELHIVGHSLCFHLCPFVVLCIFVCHRVNAKITNSVFIKPRWRMGPGQQKTLFGFWVNHVPLQSPRQSDSCRFYFSTLSDITPVIKQRIWYGLERLWISLWWKLLYSPPVFSIMFSEPQTSVPLNWSASIKIPSATKTLLKSPGIRFKSENKALIPLVVDNMFSTPSLRQMRDLF